VPDKDPPGVIAILRVLLAGLADGDPEAGTGLAGPPLGGAAAPPGVNELAFGLNENFEDPPEAAPGLPTGLDPPDNGAAGGLRPPLPPLPFPVIPARCSRFLISANAISKSRLVGCGPADGPPRYPPRLSQADPPAEARLSDAGSRLRALILFISETADGGAVGIATTGATGLVLGGLGEET